MFFLPCSRECVGVWCVFAECVWQVVCVGVCAAGCVCVGVWCVFAECVCCRVCVWVCVLQGVCVGGMWCVFAECVEQGVCVAACGVCVCVCREAVGCRRGPWR